MSGLDADRLAWAEALSAARGFAELAADGRTGDRDGFSIMAGRVRRLKATRFPLRAFGAQAAAEAFLVLGRAFVAAGPPGIVSLARGLAAVADDLIAMLDADTRAAFARSLRATGEDARG